MRNRLLAATLFAGPCLMLAAAPALAEHRSHRVLVCDGRVKHKTNNGTLIGAVAGGVLGNVVAGHGSKTEGTVIGAGVGAVAGHQIAKKRARRGDCHYVYR